LDPRRITALVVLLAITASIALMFILSHHTTSVAQRDNVSYTAPVEQAGNSSPTVSSELCLLKVLSDKGVEEIHVSGNKTCPASYVVEIIVKRGYRLRRVRIGAHEYNSTIFTVTLTDNATLIVLTERIYVSLRVLVNGSAPYLVNGSERRGDATLRVPLGARVNITGLQGRWRGFELAPLNRSTTVEATGNMTVHLYWLRRCQGVYVTSNVPVPLLPACHKPPLTLSYGLAGPTINATHRYWLAWYWIEENGSRHWWSPGINGTKLHIPRPANITLHYIPGLKDLPYVLRVYKWPEPYFNGSCPLSPGKAVEDIEVKDGWVHLYNFRPCTWPLSNTKYLDSFVVMGLDGSVGVVKVEVYVPSWKSSDMSDIVYVILDRGCKEANSSSYFVKDTEAIPAPHRLVVLYDGRGDESRYHGYWGKYWDRTGTQYIQFNMYGFVNTTDFGRYLFKYPCAPKILRIDVFGGLARDVYIRVLGVAPGDRG